MNRIVIKVLMPFRGKLHTVSPEVKVRALLLFIVGSVGLVMGGIMLLLVIHRTVEAQLSNGGVIRITPAFALTALLTEASCKIVYQPKNGEVGVISLLQDSDGCLAMVMPAKDGKCLLALYYADVHYRLIRIDPAAQSRTFHEGSYLNYISLASPWNIEEGTSNDWEEVHMYLKTVPQDILKREVLPTQELGVFSSYFDRETLLSEVEREIYNSQRGWTY
ncbi:MAG: hypothetical protein ACLQU3_33340 [Limisphaerales bacterium]